MHVCFPTPLVCAGLHLLHGQGVGKARRPQLVLLRAARLHTQIGATIISLCRNDPAAIVTTAPSLSYEGISFRSPFANSRELTAVSAWWTQLAATIATTVRIEAATKLQLIDSSDGLSNC